MPFIRMPGIDGLVYVPEDDPAAAKKYPCPDCHACQWCSDERCDICMQGQSCCRKKEKEKEKETKD